MLIISEYMNAEHAALDMLWLNFLSVCNNSDQIESAKKLLLEYKEKIVLHMKLEDEYLFPRISLHLGFDGNAPIIARALADHGVLLKLLNLAEEVFINQEKEKLLRTGNNFMQAIIKHHERESEIQYPVSDKFISEDEWAEILGSVYDQPNDASFTL